MGNVDSAIGPGPKLSLSTKKSIMALGAALTCAKGDVMMVDESIVDADHDYTTIVVPTTAELQHGLFCVCLEAQATAGGNVLVGWIGTFEVKVDGATDVDIDAGTTSADPLIAVNAARNLADGDAATGAQKIIGKWVEGVDYTTAALALKWVMFDGINGFGAVT